MIKGFFALLRVITEFVVDDGKVGFLICSSSSSSSSEFSVSSSSSSSFDLIVHLQPIQ